MTEDELKELEERRECDNPLTREERALIAEVRRLNRVLAQELSENDELGSEFTYVNALKQEINNLKDQVSDADWFAYEVNKYVIPGESDTGDSVKKIVKDRARYKYALERIMYPHAPMDVETHLALCQEIARRAIKGE